MEGLVIVQGAATTAREHYESFNGRTWDRAAGLVTDDVEWTNIPAGATFRGQEGYCQFLQSWTTAMPDAQVEIRNVVAQGDSVVVEFVGRGTQTGPLVGPQGEIPPTGRSIEIAFCEIMELQEGKIVKGRLYYDLLTLLRQLGVAS